jgi:hypothetical protein
MKRVLFLLVLAGSLVIGADAGEKGGAAKDPPADFTSLFNGKDLSLWKDADKQPEWTVANGLIYYTGKDGKNLATAQKYKNFELWVDWKIAKGSESGIYLRGKPQVQIGGDEGSGGLSTNKKGSDGQLPLYAGKLRKDKKPGDWNTFYIKMVGSKVTVALNDVIVVDNAVFLDGKIPAEGPIELQAHGTPVWFRNVFVREIVTGGK